jgi:hypothetical protein
MAYLFGVFTTNAWRRMAGMARFTAWILFFFTASALSLEPIEEEDELF